jgi:hypothetical protein
MRGAWQRFLNSNKLMEEGIIPRGKKNNLHHPGTRSDVKQTISWTDVAMQHMFFFMLDESSCRGVNDALRLACSTRT